MEFPLLKRLIIEVCFQQQFNGMHSSKAIAKKN